MLRRVIGADLGTTFAGGCLVMGGDTTMVGGCVVSGGVAVGIVGDKLFLLTFTLIYCSFIYHTRKLEKLGVFHFRFFICKVNHLCRRLKEESREWLSMTCEWNLKKCSNQRDQCLPNNVADVRRIT